MPQVITSGVASADVRIDTNNHRIAAQHVPPGAGPNYAKPSQVTWADLHSVVNGKTLGRRFRDALERLERLLYAVRGSMPPSYAPFVQWNMRYHPRCNWLAEQWEWKWCGTRDIYGNPNCGRIFPESFYEYAASGRSAGIPVPQVPVRSRSGDPILQVLQTPPDKCDREHFPVGSVTRSIGAEAFDPRGTGWFGGDPTRIGHGGARQYAWEQQIAGEPVEIHWECPIAFAGQMVPGSVKLHWNGNTAVMALASGKHTAAIPVQDHNTTIRWYLEATFLQNGIPVSRYEPGGATAPALADQYSFVAFTHFNPYAHGLPELWACCRKGTDGYQFDGTETIQAELINLVRYVLDYLGRRIVHSPRLRSSLPTCCLHIPIKWRWSGSAPWPHYRSGGKASARPLHNLDRYDATGEEEAARRSWRGVPFQAGSQYGNRVYPQNEHEASWLTPVENVGNDEGSQIIRYMLHPPGNPDVCKTYWNSAHRGLQHGDVIDPVHILELIAAIDYLIDNGIWIMQPIKRRPVTPTQNFIGGYPCGWSNVGNYVGECEQGGHHFEPGLVSNAWTCKWRMRNTTDCDEPGDPYDTVPFPAPESWLDCWQSTTKLDGCGVPKSWPFGVCSIQQQRIHRCSDYHDWQDNTQTCGIYPAITQSMCMGGVGTGGVPICNTYCGPYHGIGLGGCVSWQNYRNTREFGCRHISAQWSCGWEAWVCGPVRAPEGPDLLHGNSLMKARMDHDCPFPNATTGGVYYSMGNRLGDVMSCAIPVDTGATDLSFEETKHLYLPGWTDILGLDFSGMCQDCDACVSEDEVPDPPGYIGKWDMYDPPNYSCDSSCYDHSEGLPPGYHDNGSTAQCGMSLDGLEMCAHDYVWCAVDLNLDGAGHAHTPAGYSGERMPTLYDYVANPEGTSWKNYSFAICTQHSNPNDPNSPCVAWYHQTDCPCETADPSSGSCGAHPDE